MTRHQLLRRAPSSATIALLPALLLGGCQAVPTAAPPPAPTPAPSQAPAPQPPAPPPPAVGLPWDTAPVATGEWSWRREGADSLAVFTAGQQQRQVAIRCIAATRQLSVSLSPVAVPASALTIRTSYGDLQWAAASSGGSAGGLVATRPARDNGFDWIAFSRGRIALELNGASYLIVPVWAEIARVVEDCRN